MLFLMGDVDLNSIEAFRGGRVWPKTSCSPRLPLSEDASPSLGVSFLKLPDLVC
jgi:hypothetical protein